MARRSGPSGASTVRDEMAMSGQRLLAASRQIAIAAHTRAVDVGKPVVFLTGLGIDACLSQQATRVGEQLS